MDLYESKMDLKRAYNQLKNGFKTCLLRSL